MCQWHADHVCLHSSKNVAGLSFDKHRSVFQHNSWSYLDVHPEMMKCLVEEVQAPEEFAEMIYAFRARERETEDAFMGNPFQLSRGHRSKSALQVLCPEIG